MRPRFSQALANRGCRISGQPFPKPVAKASEDNGSITGGAGAVTGEASRRHGADHAGGTPLPIRRDGVERHAREFQSASSCLRTQDATAGGNPTELPADHGCRISGEPFPVLESEGVFSFSAFCNASAGNASDKIPASSFQSASSSSRTQDATAGGVAPALLPAVTLSPAAEFLLGLVSRHHNRAPAKMLAELVADRAEQRGLPYWPDESGMMLVLLAADADRDEGDLAAEIIAEEADAIGLSPLLTKHFDTGDAE